jgi:hypothetical protein
MNNFCERCEHFVPNELPGECQHCTLQWQRDDARGKQNRNIKIELFRERYQRATWQTKLTRAFRRLFRKP